MEKLIRVSGKDTEEVNTYLNLDWHVKDMKAIATNIDRPMYHTYAYVLLEKN